jgi:uncharacterized protein YlxW (UPF0749 family)
MTNTAAFMTFPILCLVAIVIVFAMKYFTAASRGKAAERDRTAIAQAIDGLRVEVAQLSARVSAVEKLLKEVE